MNQPEFDYLGPYHVEKTLGRGGMGSVYKGIHAKSNEVVAIKVIAPSMANQTRFRRRFEAEIKTLQRLKHPNIVTLKGTGEERGLLFYTMEYVDGLSLHEHLRTHKRLPWEDVVEIGIQMAAALKHAHDLGIIHRDLKPANLMHSSEGLIKLTDFGIAKLFGSSDMTAAGTVIGTADFMPPEQAEGKTVTIRSDLYGLGAVLYALLSGQAPFSGKSVPEVLYAVRYTPVKPLESFGLDIPSELCTLVHELIEKSPGDRPPTGLVVGNRLKSLQKGIKHVKKQDATQPAEPPKSARNIGTELTSLDLSDVNDDELKLTNVEDTALENTDAGSEHKPTPDSQNDFIPNTSMHEQATMLAPEKREPTSDDRQGTEIKKGDVEFGSDVATSHGGLTSVPSADGSMTSGGQSHYTPVEGESNTSYTLTDSTVEETQGTDWGQLLSIIGLATLLVGCIGFAFYRVYTMNNRSAEDLYAEIMEANDSGDPDELENVSESIDTFLSRYEDHEKADQIRLLQEELESSKESRDLARQIRRLNQKQTQGEQLSLLERGFLTCMQIRFEDRAQARQKMQAFLRVFDNEENLSDPQRSRLIKLIRRALALVENEKIKAKTELQVLLQDLQKDKTGDELQEAYESIQTLFGDEAFAKEPVDWIQEKIEGPTEP